jgi:hypothetical protein
MKRVVEYKVTRDIADYTSGAQRLPGELRLSLTPWYLGLELIRQYNGRLVRQFLRLPGLRADHRAFTYPLRSPD